MTSEVYFDGEHSGLFVFRVQEGEEILTGLRATKEEAEKAKKEAIKELQVKA